MHAIQGIHPSEKYYSVYFRLLVTEYVELTHSALHLLLMAALIKFSDACNLLRQSAKNAIASHRTRKHSEQQALSPG